MTDAPDQLSETPDVDDDEPMLIMNWTLDVETAYALSLVDEDDVFPDTPEMDVIKTAVREIRKQIEAGVADEDLDHPVLNRLRAERSE